ncbi:aminotransferase class III-fold pyridoxal phosphate-dependent enzyme [Acetobacter sp. TBRC 12305]|uniref:Aminotransferase class III-fold pyridoxal phosphate-dependent enzyme n=1 Tax=Acetobacter garciniae TaxID=2817435 RepID=A0A939HL72_9PROT|nr:aminotransferase class III-fold pyridoxal phosphate-dependent enzyme [Acetobacter garciniae]MBO1325547.1 aminotransferase class III-fold pyridoxal phosphate-dependent enzyme [Acetobacter garciniae]MBX0345281.1 aminotransferase class III-fold pyridoxal phosphate-dependent enzyme [Acetobacter garciniae]
MKNSLISYPLHHDEQLRARARKVIPNGMYGHLSTMLLPTGRVPQFFARGEGAYVWDTDGNRYLDYMCAYGPNLFGYGQPEVNAAFVEQMQAGDVLTGPGPAMVDLAENMTGMIGHADWAMFCKDGTDASSIALMIARAHTGRRKIIRARRAYHGSASWCTPIRHGVIAEDTAHQIFCDYNDTASLQAAIDEAGDDLAAIFVTPFQHDTFAPQAMADPAYMRLARDACDRLDAVLIADEIRCGFRLSRDSAMTLNGVAPDLSTWGKVLANGHPLSAVLGSDRLRAAAASIYVTGSYWYGAAAMAAANVTMRLIRETPYLEKLSRLGEALRTGLDEVATRHGYAFQQTGPVEMPLFLFEGDPDMRLGYRWTTEMLARGIYVHPWHNMFLNDAMTEDDIAQTIAAANESFAALRQCEAELTAPPELAILRKMVDH